MSKEIFQCGKQETSEAPALRVRAVKEAFLHQIDKEILCEILRIRTPIPATANEGVNRIAIQTVELFQSLPCLDGLPCGTSHNSPLGGEKIRVSAGS